MAGLFLPRLSRELVNRKKRVLQSVVAIVKIATGRETLLIGPSAAFGANARRHLIRDRNRLRHKLDVFMTRPGAADLIRPYLRRWGLHWAHSRLSERETIKDALLRAVASGQLAIAVMPETTLALAAMRPADNDFARAARLAQQPAGDALPNAIVDRVAIVLEMVPRYLTGAAKKAFEDAVASIGIGVMAGIFATWLTAHAVPGVDIALFILDVYFLGSGVIAAFDAITETMRRVANARSRADLEPAAKAVAEAITALVVAGIFHKLMKAREPARGPGKEGGLQVVEKPGGGPKESKAVREPRRPRSQHEGSDEAGGPSKTSKPKQEESPKPVPKFKYDLTPGVDTGQPILFGQKGVSPSFSSKGRFKGASIDDVVKKLKSGELTPDDLPVEYIWVNGQKVVVNNRSLTTLTKAGMKPSKAIDMTGKLPEDGPDSLSSVLQRLDEMGGKPSRTSNIRAGDGWDSDIAETVSLPED